jgi:hypothetical protein
MHPPRPARRAGPSPPPRGRGWGMAATALEQRERERGGQAGSLGEGPHGPPGVRPGPHSPVRRTPAAENGAGGGPTAGAPAAPAAGRSRRSGPGGGPDMPPHARGGRGTGERADGRLGSPERVRVRAGGANPLSGRTARRPRQITAVLSERGVGAVRARVPAADAVFKQGRRRVGASRQSICGGASHVVYDRMSRVPALPCPPSQWSEQPEIVNQ